MSKINKGIVVSFLCLGVVGALGAWIFVIRFFFPGPGEVLQVVERPFGDRKIRVTAYLEKNSFVPGGYYVFEIIDGERAAEIMTFRHDDPVPIRHESIKIVSPEVAFVFMGWMLALTSDGGQNWRIWDAREHLPDLECCNHSLISSVAIGDTGRIVMNLNATASHRLGISALYSDDMGKSWQPLPELDHSRELLP